MQLGKLENSAYDSLRKNRFDVFRIRDLCLLLSIKKIKAYNIIKSLKKKGAILKIKNGLFSFKDVDEFIIATSVHNPSYISFWSALNYYGFTENMPKKIFLATTKYSKEINNFKYITLSKKRFFGYIKTGNLVIADKEKAIADSLLLPKYAGGIKEVIKSMKNALNHIDIKKLILYSEKMQSKSVLRRLGYILEIIDRKSCLEVIHKKIGRGYELFDPSLERKNNLNSKWLLDINT